MYRKLYVDRCVDIVCNAVKVQSPLTLEQLCQIIQENLPGSCVPKDNLKEDARLVILDDSSFTIEYNQKKHTPGMSSCVNHRYKKETRMKYRILWGKSKYRYVPQTKSA